MDEGIVLDAGTASGAAHTELVIMEGLQAEGGRTLWSKLTHQVRRTEKI